MKEIIYEVRTNEFEVKVLSMFVRLFKLHFMAASKMIHSVNKNVEQI